MSSSRTARAYWLDLEADKSTEIKEREKAQRIEQFGERLKRGDIRLPAY